MKSDTLIGILNVELRPAKKLGLSKTMVGKTVLLDVVNTNVAKMEVKIAYISHLPAGRNAVLNDAAIAEMFKNVGDWKNNMGIVSGHHKPSKKTPLDIDLMKDGLEAQPDFLSHVILRMKDKKKVSFSKELHSSGMPLVISQAKDDPEDVGSVANASQFTVDDEKYAQFFITRGVKDPGLVNYAVALEYIQPSGNVVPVIIDPGSQNQRP